MQWVRCETMDEFTAAGAELQTERYTELGVSASDYVGPGWYAFDCGVKKHPCGCCQTTYVTAKTADTIAREIEERIESLGRQLGEASLELIEVREKQAP